MITHFLMGILSSVVARCVSLQSSGHMVRGCDGDDCSFHVLAHNKSATADGRIVCECCWRDCEQEFEDVQDLHELRRDSAFLEGPLPIHIGDVDAWIICNAPKLAKEKLEWNMYTPILETVKTALVNEGSRAVVIGAWDVDKMIQGVKKAVTKGRRPLVFTVAHDWWREHVDIAIGKLREAKDAGAFLVQYNAEPGFGQNGSDAYSTQVKVMDWAKRMDADEVWDYTMSNVDHYQKKSWRPIIRYVPPGYVRKLDVGVNISSPHKNISAIGYMGNTHTKTMHNNYDWMLQGMMHTRNDVWTREELKRYLEEYPLQLNQHRWQTCCPRQQWEEDLQHFEAFRMSSLLANKACVISAPSATKDMHKWQSMVTFAEVLETMAAITWRQKDLVGCRLNSYETYKREFDPSKLLHDSGFFNAWLPPHGGVPPQGP